MKFFSYMRVALFTTVNIVLNGATLGRYVWLEGRVENGFFSNWARRFRYRPQELVKPTTEQELVDVIKNARRIRVFGSGHSFNSGVVSEETLVSLDDYSGLIWKDLGTRQMAVKGGTRVRDVVTLLLGERLAFQALPSHDAQSIAGVLSTDVHGTGRDWGFVNESIVGLKLVDGTGKVHECGPADDLFKAAVGGIGAVGVISEVVVQGVERFTVEQKVQTKALSSVERDLDRLLEENEHMSLYLFPFSDECRVNTWNRTDSGLSTFGDVREFVRTAIDALGAAWVGNLLAYSGLLRKVSSLVYGVERGSNLILESNKAFNRTLYHLHQELEFTVPFEDTFGVLRRFVRLYEQMYHLGLPYTIFEVRFTPKRERTLIGAGTGGRRCAWIDLVCNDSEGFERYYAAAGELAKEMGARPHLGKFCDAFDERYLSTIHQESFTRFRSLMERHDPDGKFVNDFTRRLFRRGQ